MDPLKNAAGNVVAQNHQTLEEACGERPIQPAAATWNAMSKEKRTEIKRRVREWDSCRKEFNASQAVQAEVDSGAVGSPGGGKVGCGEAPAAPTEEWWQKMRPDERVSFLVQFMRWTACTEEYLCTLPRPEKPAGDAWKALTDGVRKDIDDSIRLYDAYCASKEQAGKTHPVGFKGTQSAPPVEEQGEKVDPPPVEPEEESPLYELPQTF